MRSAVAARSHIRRQNLALARQRKRRIFYVFTSSGNTVSLGWMVSDFLTSKPTIRRAVAEFAFLSPQQVPTLFVNNAGGQAFDQTQPLKKQSFLASDAPLYMAPAVTYIPGAFPEYWQTSKPKKNWQETSFIVGAPPASALTANFPWGATEFWQTRKPFQLTQTWSDSPLAPMSAQALTANFPWGVAEFWQTKKPQKSLQDAVFASILPISAAAISLQWNQALDPSSPLKRQIYPAFNAPLAPPSLAPTLPLVAAEFWQTSKPSRPPREGVFFIQKVTQIAASIIWGWEAQFSVPHYHLGMQFDGFNNFVSQPTPYPNLSILIIGDFSPTSLLVYDYNSAVDLCG